MKALFLLLLAALPAISRAQSTQIVPPNDPVYIFVDRLVALRLVDTVIVGQRMLSRLEIGRILAEARRRHAASNDWLGARLAQLATEYPASVERAAVTAVAGGEITATESPARGIAPDNTGAISVSVNPLLANQMGRPHANGNTVSTSAGFSAPILPWLVVEAAGRESWLQHRGGTTATEWLTERAYARATWKNVALLAGRDYTFFGQGNSAGLIASLNPRGVDQIRLSSDRAFLFPSVLRVLGPSHATILLGDLGKDQFFPHTRYLAYKLSIRPHRRFEVSAFLAEQVGGRGAPGGTLAQKAGDAFPLLDALFLHRNFLFSNKLVGMEYRYSVSRGLQFYAEGVFDDFDMRRVRSVFTEDAGYIWGLSLTPGDNGVRASAEYHVTGVRYYTHGTFRGGFTVDDQFIGDPLGPRGQGAYGRVDVDRNRDALQFDFAYESRSGHKYGAVHTPPRDDDFRFVVIETNPTERRWRVMTSWRTQAAESRLSFRLGGGVELAENFGHVADVWRTNWLLQTGFDYRLIQHRRP